MKKLFQLTALSAGFILTSLVQGQAASTNVVQNVNFALTFLEQGPTHSRTNVTVKTATRSKLLTKDLIAALGPATTNTFSPSARLVRVRNVNATTNDILFEVRDGTNRVDVSSLVTLSHSAAHVDVGTSNSETGVTTGTTTDILHLHVTNAPPYNLTISLRVSGLCTTTHTGLKDGKTVLGVDEIKAEVAGTGVDEHGVSAVVFGTVNVLGRVTEVK